MGGEARDSVSEFNPIRPMAYIDEDGKILADEVSRTVHALITSKHNDICGAAEDTFRANDNAANPVAKLTLTIRWNPAHQERHVKISARWGARYRDAAVFPRPPVPKPTRRRKQKIGAAPI